MILATLFVVSNGILSFNAYNLYALKEGIPIGSAYFPPNADLPVFEELVENKRIILGQNEGHINQVCYLISKDCVVEENKADDLDNHTFINLGLLRSMYEFYAPLFGFGYDEYEAPTLYVEPYDPRLLLYYRDLCKGLLPALVVTGIVGKICAIFINKRSWGTLSILIVIILLVYVICLLTFGMNNEEKGIIKRIIKKADK